MGQLPAADITELVALVVDVQHHLAEVVDTLGIATLAQFKKMRHMMNCFLKQARIYLRVILR